MATLLQTDKFGAINATDPTTLGYYIVNNVYDTFTLQKYINKDGKISNPGKISVKSD